MNNYKQGGFKKRGGGFGGRSKFGGGRGRDSRSGGNRPPVELFKTECAECEKSCEVPFRPTTDKPVFCRDCFAKQNAGNDRPDRGRDHGKGASASWGGQPQTRFSRPTTQHNELAAVQRQMEAITARLDRIIELISSPASLSTLLERATEAEAETEE